MFPLAGWMEGRTPAVRTLDAVPQMHPYWLKITRKRSKMSRPWDVAGGHVGTLAGDGSCCWGDEERMDKNFRDAALAAFKRSAIEAAEKQKTDEEKPPEEAPHEPSLAENPTRMATQSPVAIVDAPAES